MLLHLFDLGGCVECPGKVLRDTDNQELKTGHMLHFNPINGSVCGPPCTPVVHSNPFGLLGVDCKIVVGIPCCQVLTLFLVGRLIIVTNQA